MVQTAHLVALGILRALLLEFVLAHLVLEVPACCLGQEAGALDLGRRLVLGLEHFVMPLGIHLQLHLPAARTDVPPDPGYAALVDRLLLVLEDAILLEELLAPGVHGLQRCLDGLLARDLGVGLECLHACGDGLVLLVDGRLGFVQGLFDVGHVCLLAHKRRDYVQACLQVLRKSLQWSQSGGNLLSHTLHVDLGGADAHLQTRHALLEEGARAGWLLQSGSGSTRLLLQPT
mmetsp:Transcript_154201/g.494397  ORF Transcript_154201/g.494397 Transcript_154201/m.494397 type:complete len:232 (-) Transcript_154201:18-713(-)